MNGQYENVAVNPLTRKTLYVLFSERAESVEAVAGIGGAKSGRAERQASLTKYVCLSRLYRTRYAGAPFMRQDSVPACN